MNAEERTHIESLLQIHRAHLRELELKAAKYGDLDVPTHITLQIADYRQKIMELEQHMHADLPHHNLPPRDFDQFVGRQQELADVRKLLLPYPKSRYHLVTIDGIGGIGKSALALEIAYTLRDGYANLPQAERFDAIVWVSAKRSYLTADGILERRQAFRTLDDLYAAIAQVLNFPAITRAKAEEQRAIVERVLAEQRTLLVLDNLETVDDEGLLVFLRELPDPTKAIVTTRHRIDVAYPVRLTGLPHTDALGLIEQESGRKNVILSAEDREQLWRRTGGVPLAIVWSIGLMGLGGSVESVLHRLGSGQSDITKFCFEESARQIHSKDAHVLLMSLTLFSPDASREALGMVAGLGEDEFGRDTGLEELLRLSLVNKTGERFSLLPLTASFAKAETARYLPWFTEARTRWHNYFFAVSYEIGEDTQPRRDANRIERDLANMVAVIEDVAAHLQYRETPERERLVADESLSRARELILFCDPVAHTCYERGYWSECERICALAIRLCRMVHDQAMLGWRYYNLCRIYVQRSEFDAAESAIQEVLSAWSSAGNRDWISHSYRILASILQFRGQTDAAEEHYQRAIAGYQASSNPEMAIYVHTTSASLDELHGDLASAMRRYREILEILRRENRQGFLTSIHYRLGQLTLADGDLVSARVHLSEGLQIAEERHFASMIARYLYQLAELERAQGQQEAAATAMHDALAMFRRLGLRREQDQGEALLAQLGANF